MRVLTANGDDLTDSSDPSRKMMRQIAGYPLAGAPFRIMTTSEKDVWDDVGRLSVGGLNVLFATGCWPKGDKPSLLVFG